MVTRLEPADQMPTGAAPDWPLSCATQRWISTFSASAM
jgi:hypothetical protein